MDKLHLIAEFLVAYEIMDGDQFLAAMEGDPTVEELDELKKEKKRRSDEENKKRAEQNRREQEARERAERQDEENDE